MHVLSSSNLPLWKVRNIRPCSPHQQNSLLYNYILMLITLYLNIVTITSLLFLHKTYRKVIPKEFGRHPVLWTLECPFWKSLGFCRTLFRNDCYRKLPCQLAVMDISHVGMVSVWRKVYDVTGSLTVWMAQMNLHAQVSDVLAKTRTVSNTSCIWDLSQNKNIPVEMVDSITSVYDSLEYSKTAN